MHPDASPPPPPAAEWIAHADLDAFFAAVEMHRRPHLRGRPVVVGGDERGRGVVATANYAARAFGIRSAMPAAEARRRCPEAVFIRPDLPEYRRWSLRVWEVVGRYAQRVEQVGLDEGYLVLRGDPWRQARRVQEAVAREVRLSLSLGVATSRSVAKIASDRRKPRGITVVPRGEEAAFLAPLPVRALPGCGPKTAARLEAAGITLIGGLAALEDGAREALIGGVAGRDLHRRARGVDPRPVLDAPPERKSISTERTFAEDLRDQGRLAELAGQMAAHVAGALTRRGQGAHTVQVKVRWADFDTITRAHTLPLPTDQVQVVAELALILLQGALDERRDAVRLVGVGVSGLAPHPQLAIHAAG